MWAIRARGQRQGTHEERSEGEVREKLFVFLGRTMRRQWRAAGLRKSLMQAPSLIRNAQDMLPNISSKLPFYGAGLIFSTFL